MRTLRRLRTLWSFSRGAIVTGSVLAWASRTTRCRADPGEFFAGWTRAGETHHLVPGQCLPGRAAPFGAEPTRVSFSRGGQELTGGVDPPPRVGPGARGIGWCGIGRCDRPLGGTQLDGLAQRIERRVIGWCGVGRCDRPLGGTQLDGLAQRIERRVIGRPLGGM